MKKIRVRSCSKFRMRERIGDKSKDIHKLKNGMQKVNVVKKVNRKE